MSPPPPSLRPTTGAAAAAAFLLPAAILILLISPAAGDTASLSSLYFNCLTSHKLADVEKNFFTQTSPSFLPILQSTAQNLRYLLPTITKPLVIFTPPTETHAQIAVACSVSSNIHLRVRSGGHDYEGLSYASHSPEPFVLLDLHLLRNINVDLTTHTVWVQAGATIGELYYRISQKTNVFGFPAGLYTSLGVGGHITGGAYGSMMRKHGLGADNALDVRMVNAAGEIVDRKSMGEDVFWALRGGGGGSFGVILSWQLKLVPVPSTVTVFSVPRSAEKGAAKILMKWQEVAPSVTDDLFMRVIMQPANSTLVKGKRTVLSVYNALYLGRGGALLGLMQGSFPELGLTAADCMEVSWIQSVMFLAGYPKGTSPDVLLQGKPAFKNMFKAKSDFARAAVPENAVQGLWEKMLADDSPVCIWNAFGGMMARINEAQIPFPHRKGVLFMIQYVSTWKEERAGVGAEGHMAWVRGVYEYMAPYVSARPREAYVNYRDLELGTTNQTSVAVARDDGFWGTDYYKGNFMGLVSAKTKVDPNNVFRHEQSIPPLPKSMHKWLTGLV